MLGYGYHHGYRGGRDGTTSMKTMIIGGTGLLGYHSAGHLVAAGHDVVSVSSGSLTVGSWYPASVDQLTRDVFAQSSADLAELFEGVDAVIYAVGPDDRVTPPRPADAFFNERLVTTTDRVRTAADAAGVSKLVVFGSYFTYLHRTDPTRRLTDDHPYIAARAAQLARCTGPGPSTVVFEIPYVFGVMPQREPLWNEVLVKRLDRMWPWLFFPPGGTAAASADFIGRAAAAATTATCEGPLPVGEQNIDWSTLLTVASEELYGRPKRQVTVPGRVAAVYGVAHQWLLRLSGREPGLDLGRYITQVQASHSDFPDALMAEVAADLGIERGPVEPAMRETFARCRGR